MEEDFEPWTDFDEENDKVLMRLAWKAAIRIYKSIGSGDHYRYPIKTHNAKVCRGNGSLYEFDVIYGETVQTPSDFPGYTKKPLDMCKLCLKLRPNSPLHLYRMRGWVEPPPAVRDTIQWMDKIRELDAEERQEVIKNYLFKK